MPRPARGGACVYISPEKGNMADFQLQLLRFVNVDDHPITLKHAQTGKVVMPPGAERILPIEYATLNVGHPNARNEGKNLWRDQALAHLYTRWGYYPGLMTDADWEDMRPKIELYTVDTNERVYSVLEDPEGTLANPSSLTGVEPTDGNFLQAQVASMQAQIERLTALIASSQNVDPSMTRTAPSPEQMGISTDDIGAALTQVQGEQAEDTIPPPPKGEKVGKDTPRTTRVGGRS